METFISVILPVFNAELTIARSIKSILNQTFTNFELIIVDNGSTDQTKNIILEFNDERIIYLELPHANLVAALNHGIFNSKGKYIARMDADDFSHEIRLQVQVDYLEQNNDIDLVSGQVNYVGDQSRNEGYFIYVNWANSIKNSEGIYLNRFCESAIQHQSVMFRKSLGQQFGFYRQGNFPEDFELWNRWMSQGVRMSKVHQTVLDWHDSPGRLSRMHSMYGVDRFSQIKAQFFTKWFEKKFPTHSSDLYIWGAGGTVNKKTKPLEECGLKISKFIDVKKSQSSRSIFYQDLKFDPDIFILSYVGDRKGKLEIRDYLKNLGFKEGKNFYMME